MTTHKGFPINFPRNAQGEVYAFFKYAWNKVYEQGEDLVVLVSGKTGSGKTNLACACAYLLDVGENGVSRFPLQQRVDTKMVHLPRLVQSVPEYERLKALRWPVGSAFVIDESQFLFNSRRAMSGQNLQIVKYLSTGRIFRSINFFTAPQWRSLDSQVRELAHVVLESKRPLKRHGLSRFSFKIPYRATDGDIKLKPYKGRDAKGLVTAADLHYLRIPHPDLLKAVELKTLVWKEAVTKKLVNKDGTFKTEKDLMAEAVKKRDKKEGLYEAFERLKAQRFMFRDHLADKYMTTRLMMKEKIPHSMANTLCRLFEEEDRQTGSKLGVGESSA